MSGVLVALAGPGVGEADEGTPLLRALGPDAGDRRASWRDVHAWLGCRTHDWEEALAAGASPLLVTPDLVVAADATLHYVGELTDRLGAGGLAPPPGTVVGAAALIAAAYRAWGDAAAEALEGEFAFVVLDRARGRLVAARDFTGRRPLYWARVGSRLVLASSPAAVVAHPACPPALNLAHIAGRTAGLLEAWDTAYDSVSLLAAGRTLVAEIERDGRVAAPVVRRHWTPPTFEAGGGLRFDDAAEALRDVLRRATAERLAPVGPTAVWLSGGWDSSSVYALAQDGVRDASGRPEVRAVSMSYPQGDAGREDELIEAVVRFWGGRVCWRDVDGVPVLGSEADARRRGEPFAHAFEQWMRALGGTARESGARIVLDGSGGDQLFQVSPVYLADLVRRGRWREARREWRALGLTGAGWRRFARFGVLPLLPAPAWRLAALLRGGRALRGLRAGVVPAWIRPAYRDALAERAELQLPRRAGESESARESRWYFETSYSAAVFAEQRAIVRQAGLEVRSPLHDARVVRLAAERPREERSSGGETKRLLRHALRGLLPAEVLAPRRSRTGVTSHYFRRAMLRELPGALNGVFQVPMLVELGLVDPAELRRAVERYSRQGDAEAGAALFATVQTERWLRARDQTCP